MADGRCSLARKQRARQATRAWQWDNPANEIARPTIRGLKAGRPAAAVAATVSYYDEADAFARWQAASICRTEIGVGGRRTCRQSQRRIRDSLWHRTRTPTHLSRLSRHRGRASRINGKFMVNTVRLLTRLVAFNPWMGHSRLTYRNFLYIPIIAQFKGWPRLRRRFFFLQFNRTGKARCRRLFMNVLAAALAKERLVSTETTNKPQRLARDVIDDCHSTLNGCRPKIFRRLQPVRNCSKTDHAAATE